MTKPNEADRERATRHRGAMCPTPEAHGFDGAKANEVEASDCNECTAIEFATLREETIKIEGINNDMANGIIAEIRQLLESMPCMHGQHDRGKTPPMMFREWILCAFSKARLQSGERMQDAAASIGEQVGETLHMGNMNLTTCKKVAKAIRELDIKKVLEARDD